MKSNLNILIIEDSLIFIQGLESLLKTQERIQHVFSAQNLEKALRIMETSSIDVVILDLNFDTEDFNGFSVAKKLRRLYPEAKILVLTEHVRVFIHHKLFNECDVHAYVDKQLGFEHVSKAINAIIAGEKYVDPNVVKMLELGEKMKISKREKEVLPYLIDGYTQKEIGEKLFISKKTIEKHIENTAKKFGVKRTVPLVVNYLKYMFSNRENSEGGFTPFD